MKKLLTLLVLPALIFAAKPVNPSFVSVTCTGGISAFGCAQPVILVNNADPAESYVIEGVSVSEEFTSGPIQPAADGTIELQQGASLDLGVWTFEIHKIGNNGNPMHKALDTLVETFEVTP